MLQKLYRLLERQAPHSFKTLFPESWRIWLGRQIKESPPLRSRKMLAHLHHPLTLPAGHSEKSLFSYLSQYYIEEDGPNQERVHYLREAFHRFLYTLALIPADSQTLLDVGANPYFLTLLLKLVNPAIKMELINYFGSFFPEQAAQTLVNDAGDKTVLDFTNINIETDTLPFDDNSFDTALLCEVIEHFTNDPLRALLEIKRVLKPDGYLVLTTPNVARLENVARLIAGKNLYDPYSGYGPYGRHNREFTCDELSRLLNHAGFTVDIMFTSDIYHNHAASYFNLNRLQSLLRHRKGDLGHYIFIRAHNSRPGETRKPSWLYRNYPAEALV